MTFIRLLKNEHIGYLSAIMAAILFGSVSTITKPMLEDLNALSISSLLYIIAGLSLVPLLKSSSINSNNITIESTRSNKNKNKNRKYYFYF